MGKIITIWGLHWHKNTIRGAALITIRGRLVVYGPDLMVGG